jgi:hypothetical protein
VAKHRLKIERTADIPLPEVSGICLFRRPGGDLVLVAIGDASAILVAAPVVDDRLGDWQEHDLAAAAPGIITPGGIQVEGVDGDAAGMLLLLREQPSQALVADTVARRLVTTVELDVPRGPVARAWEKGVNSRGEGLVLLDGGHLLVVKEKDPPALLEFGPAGATPGGFGPDRILGPGASWQVPSGEAVRYEALATWLLDDDLADDVGDVSDLAVDASGHLHLLSDQRARLVRLAPELRDGKLVADVVATIEGKPDKAEGLVMLPDGRALVALDTKRPRENLLLVEPLPDG